MCRCLLLVVVAMCRSTVGGGGGGGCQGCQAERREVKLGQCLSNVSWHWAPLQCATLHGSAVCVCSMQTGPVTLSTRCVYVCNAGHGQDAGEADCHGNSGRWRGSGNRGWCSQHSVSLGSA